MSAVGRGERSPAPPRGPARATPRLGGAALGPARPSLSWRGKPRDRQGGSPAAGVAPSWPAGVVFRVGRSRLSGETRPQLAAAAVGRASGASRAWPRLGACHGPWTREAPGGRSRRRPRLWRCLAWFGFGRKASSLNRRKSQSWPRSRWGGHGAGTCAPAPAGAWLLAASSRERGGPQAPPTPVLRVPPPGGPDHSAGDADQQAVAGVLFMPITAPWAGRGGGSRGLQCLRLAGRETRHEVKSDREQAPGRPLLAPGCSGPAAGSWHDPSGTSPCCRGGGGGPSPLAGALRSPINIVQSMTPGPAPHCCTQPAPRPGAGLQPKGCGAGAFTHPRRWGGQLGVSLPPRSPCRS